MQIASSRRQLIGALVAAPVVAAARLPAGSLRSDDTPFRLAEARYRATQQHFNALPGSFETSDPAGYAREVDALLFAARDVEAAPVADWGEFTDQFGIACDEGESLMNEETMFKLLADARRLATEGR